MWVWMWVWVHYTVGCKESLPQLRALARVGRLRCGRCEQRTSISVRRSPLGEAEGSDEQLPWAEGASAVIAQLRCAGEINAACSAV
jgi:hypothetical protein